MPRRRKQQQPLDFSDPQWNAPSNDAGPGRIALPAGPDLGSESDGSRPAPTFDVRPVRRTRSSPEPIVGRGTEELGGARLAYPVAIAAALCWAGGLAAFAVGYQGKPGVFDYEPFQLAVFAALLLLPAVFMLLAAHGVREGARLAAETRRARALAGDLITPAALAAVQAGGVVEAMRQEIERASAAAVQARDQLTSLREALADESRRLVDAATQAERAGADLSTSLARERVEMSGLAASLDAQAQGVTDAVAGQTRMIAEAADQAGAQLREAETALAVRAAELSVAAGQAVQAATDAGHGLAAQSDRLERAGAFLGERYRGLEAVLSDRHAALEGLAEGLRTDQDAAAVVAAEQQATLLHASAEVRAAAGDLAGSAAASAEALRALIATAAEQVRTMAQAAHDEQQVLETQAHARLTVFSGLVAEERQAIEGETGAALTTLAAAAEEARTSAARASEDAHRSAAERAEAARLAVEQLNETAFAAGQRADQVFDQRIGAARRLIEQSATLVEEASARSAAKMEQGLAAARGALGDLEGLITEVDSHIGRLPEAAKQQVDGLRAAVARGVHDLTAAARQAADETQAIDAAFQSRIRRNYEMLSEAVRLMGKVAGAAEGGAARPAPEPEPPRAISASAPDVARPVAAPARAVAAVEEPRAEPLAAVAGERPFRAAQPRFGQAASPGATAASAGLRPRLKLTPTAGDVALQQLFQPALPNGAGTSSRVAEPALEPVAPSSSAEQDATPRPAPAPEEWTWKDLLSSLDEGPVDDEALADRMVGEIETLGVDAAAVLPNGRLGAIAASIQSGDAAGAREQVRTAAPAALRRLSRRVQVDQGLRAQADRYVQRYQALMDDARARDEEGYMATALLSADAGRAYLLLDAALRDAL